MTQSHLHPVSNDNARFQAGSETVDNGNGTPPAPPTGGGEGTTKREARPRAEMPLPTDRLKFDNQVAVLRAVAATSGNNRRGSTALAMSAAIGLNAGTGGLNSRFFRSAHWFEAVGRGEYTASAGTLAYHQHITIDPDAQYEATAKMRDEVRSSWFWTTLEPMLASGHPINEKLAVLELAKAAGASSHTDQLVTILLWLEWVGLIVREEGQIKLRPEEHADAPPAAAVDADQADEIDVLGNSDPAPVVDGVDSEPTQETATESHTGSPAVTTDLDAIVSFNMSVRLTAADMKSLDQEQRDFVLQLAERLRG